MNQAQWNIAFDGLSFRVSGWRDGERISKPRALFYRRSVDFILFTAFIIAGQLYFSDNKEVLKNVSGEFRACELSAVVGQSGSGKTTLLNILSGYTGKNVPGCVKINGHKSVREIKRSRRGRSTSCKITPYITSSRFARP